jgi:hypothetical protein
MANIQDRETHFTYHSRPGSIGDSFFYFPYWYKNNFVLVTLVQGMAPSENKAWLEYLDQRGIRHEAAGRACLVHPESVERLFLDERAFGGKSEIYICNKKPPAETIPARSYPADTAEFGEELPEGFLDGLRALDALAYLSDGSGVNIAHKAKEEIIYFVKEMGM